MISKSVFINIEIIKKKPVNWDFRVVLFIMLCKVVLTLSLWMQSSVWPYKKATEQYFPVVLFYIMRYKVAQRLSLWIKCDLIQMKYYMYSAVLFTSPYNVSLTFVSLKWSPKLNFSTSRFCRPVNLFIQIPFFFTLHWWLWSWKPGSTLNPAYVIKHCFVLSRIFAAITNPKV